MVYFFIFSFYILIYILLLFPATIKIAKPLSQPNPTSSSSLFSVPLFSPFAKISPLQTGKAANAGGVAVSGLEMAQNSQRISWTAEEVDNKLKGIMEACFANGLDTAAKYVKAAEGELPSLVAGSNIAGFVKVAEATKAQGDWWV